MDGSDASGRHRSRLASAQPTGHEDQSPVFGLKKLLVQLIGNMCYRDPVIQDTVGLCVVTMSCDVMGFLQLLFIARNKLLKNLKGM